jgi:uncharacterized RDD family membrane protein YckC
MQTASPALGRQVAREADLAELLFRRWLAAMLDAVLLAGLFWLIARALETVFGAGTALWALGGWAAAAIAYFLITEGVWGQSLGKYAASVAVVDDAGRPPGVLRAAIRTLVRVIEINPLLVAAWAISFSKDRQRLGDYAAGTFVVPTAALAAAIASPAAVFD